MPTKYAVVQHSGYSVGDKPVFEKGLQATAIYTDAEQRAVEQAGGILFNTHTDAEEYCDREMYPEDVTGLHPQAPGSFSEVTVNDLRVYIPVVRVSTVGDFEVDTEVFIAQSAHDWIVAKVVSIENDTGQVAVEVVWTGGVPGYEVGRQITVLADVPAWTELSVTTVVAQAKQATD